MVGKDKEDGERLIIGKLVKLDAPHFQRESNYSHLQISGVSNSRDHRLETTPSDDTIYSASQSWWRHVACFIVTSQY